MMGEIMDTFLITKDKTCCCGCGACAAVCPTKSISFAEDDIGFSYPTINTSTCIHCGRCEAVCQYHQRPKARTAIETCVAKTKDVDVIQSSSSGGVFFELARHVLLHNGVVYGAAFDSSLHVVHQLLVRKNETNIGKKVRKICLNGNFAKKFLF